jgi:hypothetical protein
VKKGKNLLSILFLCLLLNYNSSLFAQHSEPSEIQAVKISGKIKFDGFLNDSIWNQVPHISNFTQRDLNFGQPVTERTEVAVIYNNNTLYLGIWCYQEDAGKIVAKNMNTDFDYETDDNFQIMISPFDDNRNGYLFVTNPNGARADIQIYSGEDGNEDWNAVWDVRTSRTEEGWFAEVVIPFNTLQFKKGKILDWAINFERDIVSKNEQALWQGWSRDYSIFAVVNAGKLTGITDISYAKKFEFKPYGLLGWQYDSEEGTDYPVKLGADLNVNLSPTLKLNLTTFTDFAQVEADRIPVNLTRFNLYYPEKRQFFLEGYDLYSFRLGYRNNVFYSRTIGISEGEEVPIIAGARLFGKIGKNNIGFLNIQEGKVNSIPTTNNTVLRYKRDLGAQSYVGGIFTNVINKDHSNQVIGLDAMYQPSDFLKEKNLVIEGKVAASTEDFAFGENTLSYRFYIDYPNDLIDNYMGFSSMDSDFNPELGFVRRSNYNSYVWFLRISPRWFEKWGVKRMLFKPWGFVYYQTKDTGEFESFSNETRPFGAVFKSGERFEINFIQNYDRLDEDFEITDEVTIPAGKYWMYNYEFQFETYQSRKIWAALLYKFGGFYGGDIKTFEGELGVNISKHFNLNGSYTWNLVELPDGDITTHEVAAYLNYAFTTRLNFSLFGQYNNLDEVMIYNIRLHWIPKIGSDFYFVYNIGYDETVKQIEVLKPAMTSAVAKLIYRITF